MAKCADIRALLFDYRLGSLDAADCDRVEEHLAECAGCGEHFDRLDGMLEASGEVTDQVVDSMPFDALFDRISASVASPNVAPEDTNTIVHLPAPSRDAAAATRTLTEILPPPTMQPPAADAEGPAASVPNTIGTPLASSAVNEVTAREDSVSVESSIAVDRPHVAWRLHAAIALAAMITGGLVVGLWTAGEPAAVIEEPVAELAGAVALPQRAQPARAVQIRASDRAVWSLDRRDGVSDAPHFDLTIEAGQVLVEFLPVDGAALSVSAPELSIEVVGTVFLVDTETSDVTVDVLAGAVNVRADGETLRVGRGQRATGGRLSAMPAEREASLGEVIDVEAHEAQILVLETLRQAGDYEERGVEAPHNTRPRVEEREEAPPRPRAPTRPAIAAPPEPEPAAPVERSEPAPAPSASERANRAMAERRWADAARAYEEVVADGSATGAVRLDLARLYIRRLRTEERSIPHLRAFVTENPADPASDSALRELCRVTSDAGIPEPLCP